MSRARPKHHPPQVEWCRLDQLTLLPAVPLRVGLNPRRLRRVCRERYPFPLAGHRVRYLRRRRSALIIPNHVAVPEAVPGLYLERMSRAALRRAGAWSGTLAFGTRRGHDLYRLEHGQIRECWTSRGAQAPKEAAVSLSPSPWRLRRARLRRMRVKPGSAAVIIIIALALTLAWVASGDREGAAAELSPTATRAPVASLPAVELAAALHALDPDLRLLELTAGTEEIAVAVDVALPPDTAAKFPDSLGARVLEIESGPDYSRIVFAPVRLGTAPWQAERRDPRREAAPGGLMPERWRTTIDGQEYWERSWTLEGEEAALLLEATSRAAGLLSLELRPDSGRMWHLSARGTGTALHHAVTDSAADGDLHRILRHRRSEAPRPQVARSREDAGAGGGWVRFSDGRSMSWMQREPLMHLEMTR